MRGSWTGLLMLCAGSALAAPAPFTGQDLSGNYICTGVDAHDGAYKGTAVFKLDRAHSTGTAGAYTFTVAVEGGLGGYYGSAVADGGQMAMTFSNRDPSTRDYGTGLASIKRDTQGHARLVSSYYEPDYFGGNSGTEDCIHQ